MTVTPLATAAAFTSTAYSDMAAHLQAGDLDATMLKATRACETAARRRLAPFTGLVETQRLQDTDVEDALATAIPMPMQAQMNTDYARSLGYNQLVRHFWMREYPPLYPDLWTGSVTAISVFWSYSATAYTVPVSSVQFEPDTGHGRFQLGTFIPPGSTGSITYDGGYSSVPEDLEQACIVMAASILLKSLDPAMNSTGHDPDQLRADAVALLDGYIRR